MEITTKELKRVQLISLNGRIDHEAARELERALLALIEAGYYRFVIDMNEVKYISSAGLRVLLAVRKASRRWNRGDVCLAALQPLVRDTIELVGFDKVFEVYDTVVDAVGSF